MPKNTRSILYKPTPEQEPVIDRVCKRLARPRTFVIGLGLDAILDAIDSGAARVDGKKVIFEKASRAA